MREWFGRYLLVNKVGIGATIVCFAAVSGVELIPAVGGGDEDEDEDKDKDGILDILRNGTLLTMTTGRDM